MSARREKRLRSLERRVQKLETMASAGYLEVTLREELMKNVPSMDGWWMRTPTPEAKQPEKQEPQRRTAWGKIKKFFAGGNQE